MRVALFPDRHFAPQLVEEVFEEDDVGRQSLRLPTFTCNQGDMPTAIRRTECGLEYCKCETLLSCRLGEVHHLCQLRPTSRAAQHGAPGRGEKKHGHHLLLSPDGFLRPVNRRLNVAA